MSNKKLLGLVSRSLPPLVIGSPILLYNLFSAYRGEVVAISGWQKGAKINPNFRLKANRVYHLRITIPIIQRIFESRSYLVRPIIQFYVYHKLKKERVDKVLGVCPNGEYFVAAYLAAKKLKVPFLAHMHDLWLENTYPGTKKHQLAARYEKEIIEAANVVFCMTDTQKEHLEQKYNVNCELLPHTIPAEMIKPEEDLFNPKKYLEDHRTIVYTGNVNRPINIDAMQEFVKCIDYLPDTFDIKVFISLSEEELKSIGLFHKRIHYSWQSMETVRKEMQKAHVLFLPLSFKNCSPEEVRTVFATKTLDYLTSGTPILQYAPRDSFHGKSAENKGWAHCVIKDDHQFLAEEIIKLANNSEMARKLVSAALEEAKSRSAVLHADRLLKFVQEV